MDDLKDKGYNIKTVLKHILLRKECSFGKYLSKMKYTSTRDNEQRSFYFTPLVTHKKRNVLIITCPVNENWDDVVKEIGEIVSHLHKNYSFSPKDYTHILHAYFDAVAIEQFYEIDAHNGNFLNKITIGQLDMMLS